MHGSKKYLKKIMALILCNMCIERTITMFSTNLTEGDVEIFNVFQYIKAAFFPET
jgi:hypothetical protein